MLIKVLGQVADSFAISVQDRGGVVILLVLDVRPSLSFSCPRFKIRD